MQLVRIILLVGIMISSIVFQLKSQSLEIESSNKGFLISKLDQTSINLIPLSVENDGMLVFNITTGFLEIYIHSSSTWRRVLPGVASTVNGMDGSSGPTGPEGPRGMARAGSAGPDIGDIIFQCWDFNHNGILDQSEDLNSDGMGTYLDCIGYTGPQGPQGGPGFSPKTVHNYTHTAIAGTNVIGNFTFFSGLPDLSASSRVFAIGLNYSEPIFINQSGAEFYIKTQSGNFIPNGATFNVIYTK